jgi:DNA-binding transcriptional MerR regulator
MLTAVKARKSTAKLITIKQAAILLGVAEVTLRRWDSAGKFKARRHPMNNYRVYAERAVLQLRDQILACGAA